MRTADLEMELRHLLEGKVIKGVSLEEIAHRQVKLVLHLCDDSVVAIQLRRDISITRVNRYIVEDDS